MVLLQSVRILDTETKSALVVVVHAYTKYTNYVLNCIHNSLLIYDTGYVPICRALTERIQCVTSGICK